MSSISALSKPRVKNPRKVIHQRQQQDCMNKLALTPSPQEKEKTNSNAEGVQAVLAILFGQCLTEMAFSNAMQWPLDVHIFVDHTVVCYCSTFSNNNYKTSRWDTVAKRQSTTATATHALHQTTACIKEQDCLPCHEWSKQGLPSPSRYQN
ncbi:hypothetical protein ACA910_022031 [Epithemia clementina (nom. ined.)]